MGIKSTKVKTKLNIQIPPNGFVLRLAAIAIPFGVDRP